MSTPQEPEITINGVQLTSAQAMAVRIAVSSFDADCGDDKHGKVMAAAYEARLNEVFRIMIGLPAIRSLPASGGTYSSADFDRGWPPPGETEEKKE